MGGLHLNQMRSCYMASLQGRSLNGAVPITGIMYPNVRKKGMSQYPTETSIKLAMYVFYTHL